jgi:hypothetical protein
MFPVHTSAATLLAMFIGIRTKTEWMKLNGLICVWCVTDRADSFERLKKELAVDG